jgi:SH3-like domain-containing protein
VTGETNADGWIPVTCGDQDGWVFENYLTLAEPGEPRPETTTVVTNGQNAACLAEADAGSDVVWSVANGTVVTVTGDASGAYTPVLCGDQEGWIATTLLQTDEP